MMQTVLLTGATGFLGSHLLRSLVAHNYQVIILKRSFSDTTRINDVFSKVKYYNIDQVVLNEVFTSNQIDIILHAATDYGKKKMESIDVVSANLLFPLELLFHSVHSGSLKAFINTDTIIDKRISQYSLSKHQFCDWLKFCAKDVKCINVALEHFYGFTDDRTKFISKMIDLLLKNSSSIDLTFGEQKRGFIYIDDVVEGFITILNNLDKFSSGYTNLNIGSGTNISIRQSVELIKQVTGNDITKLNFGAIPYREHELMESIVDISKLCALGWQPKISFIDGLIKTVNMERGHLV